MARACETFALGTAGAGTGATAGPLKGGLGSASAVLDNGVTVGALVAVNAHGAAAPDGVAHLWAAPWEQGGEFGGLGPVPAGAGTDVALSGGLTLPRIRPSVSSPPMRRSTRRSASGWPLPRMTALPARWCRATPP